MLLNDSVWLMQQTPMSTSRSPFQCQTLLVNVLGGRQLQGMHCYETVGEIHIKASRAFPKDSQGHRVYCCAALDNQSLQRVPACCRGHLNPTQSLHRWNLQTLSLNQRIPKSSSKRTCYFKRHRSAVQLCKPAVPTQQADYGYRYERPQHSTVCKSLSCNYSQESEARVFRRRLVRLASLPRQRSTHNILQRANPHTVWQCVNFSQALNLWTCAISTPKSHELKFCKLGDGLKTFPSHWDLGPWGRNALRHHRVSQRPKCFLSFYPSPPCPAESSEAQGRQTLRGLPNDPQTGVLESLYLENIQFLIKLWVHKKWQKHSFSS